MALVFSQPLTKMSTRTFPGGEEGYLMGWQRPWMQIFWNWIKFRTFSTACSHLQPLECGYRRARGHINTVSSWRWLHAVENVRDIIHFDEGWFSLKVNTFLLIYFYTTLSYRKQLRLNRHYCCVRLPQLTMFHRIYMLILSRFIALYLAIVRSDNLPFLEEPS